jgi:hypothetical protein
MRCINCIAYFNNFGAYHAFVPAAEDNDKNAESSDQCPWNCWGMIGVRFVKYLLALRAFC